MTTHFDPEMFGTAMGELVAEAVLPLKARIAELEKQLADMKSERESDIAKRLDRLEHRQRSADGRHRN